MKFGIAMFPADFAIRPDDLARAVEARGFESLFFPEHTHFPRNAQTESLAAYYSHTFDLFVSLAYALQATTRLLVGSGVMLAPEHDPFNAAKALASLDVLSGGRLLVGFGASWIDQELVDHGVDPAWRWTATVDTIKAIKTIWQNEVAEYHGTHHNFAEIWSWPKPLRQQGPPVLIGGNGARVLERVVALGDEWFPEDHQSVEELGARMAQLQTLAAEAGRESIPVSLFAARPDIERLKQIAALGVHRVVLYAPPADAATVLAHLDHVAELRDAVNSRG
ncbi:MAG: TIGR03619 family F420-dependent LLM class oxidoreductase [Thermomicrobiales bacterium]